MPCSTACHDEAECLEATVRPIRAITTRRSFTQPPEPVASLVHELGCFSVQSSTDLRCVRVRLSTRAIASSCFARLRDYSAFGHIPSNHHSCYSAPAARPSLHGFRPSHSDASWRYHELRGVNQASQAWEQQIDPGASDPGGISVRFSVRQWNINGDRFAVEGVMYPITRCGRREASVFVGCPQSFTTGVTTYLSSYHFHLRLNPNQSGIRSRCSNY